MKIDAIIRIYFRKRWAQFEYVKNQYPMFVNENDINVILRYNSIEQ